MSTIQSCYIKHNIKQSDTDILLIIDFLFIYKLLFFLYTYFCIYMRSNPIFLIKFNKEQFIFHYRL